MTMSAHWLISNLNGHNAKLNIEMAMAGMYDSMANAFILNDDICLIMIGLIADTIVENPMYM